jgi:hypothetical protein
VREVGEEALYRVQSAESKLDIVFAENSQDILEIEALPDGTRLYCRFTLQLRNIGGGSATYIQATFNFVGPFRFQSPMSYQTGSALPDLYWTIDSNEKGPRIRFHGGADLACHPNGRLDLATLPLTTTREMAGATYQIDYEVASLNSLGTSGSLKLHVKMRS